MPRLTETRAAAAPTTPPQRARRVRILQAAMQQAMTRDFERVQMHDVAEAADVAIGTLYRYFPSKAHLFVGVMAHQVQILSDSFEDTPLTGETPAERIFNTMWRANRYLLDHPTLAAAMIQSVQGANAQSVPEVVDIDSSIRVTLARVLGVTEPTEQAAATIRILIMVWFGILQSSLNARLSVAEAEHDLRMACTVLVENLARST